MKRFYFSLLIITAYYYSSAQEDEIWKDASKESQAYHKYRLKIIVPPYGLQKVKTFISKIKSDNDDNEVPNQKNYLSLSFREKFTYHMIHGESYSQNCDLMPPVQDEQKKIFAQLPDVFGEFGWSARQLKFFNANRDSVIELMKSSIVKNNRIGVNFKQVIVDINGKEMIPFLVKTYNLEKKDYDILTILMLLMKDNEYDQFLISTSYQKLYADSQASYTSYLNFNTLNQDLIIKRATDFYNGLLK